MQLARNRERSPREFATVDAVVIVPGIMGSSLSIVGGGERRSVWGVPMALANATGIAPESRIDALRVDNLESTGKIGHVVPTGLLMTPSWLRGFGGMEPYKRLVNTITETVPHPDAVFSFAYDWRLDIEHNARILARESGVHLQRWRNHEVIRDLRSRRNDDREPRLVFVAHSMGGLLVWAMSAQEIEQPDTRAVVTLGTPFAGSVKTMRMLAGGNDAQSGLSSGATRRACLTMPGVYDLLPWYRCRLDGDDVVALHESDVVSVGGMPDLVRQAFERRVRIADGELPGHVAVIGVGQETSQSLELKHGDIVTRNWAYRRNGRGELIRESGRLVTEDFGGDGTVFHHSARTAAAPGVPIAQRHESLGTNRACLRIVQKVIRDSADLDTVLGDGPEQVPLGLEVLDEVVPGRRLEIRIRSDHSPADITCAVEDTARGDAVVRQPVVRGRRDEGAFVVLTDLDVPGLHRVRVSVGSTEITKLVMVCADGSDT
ncbi:hypothetical protein NG2371_03533 [Nocardia gamkensis]|nr:hypothetical protein [Nocardia gamkensis]